MAHHGQVAVRCALDMDEFAAAIPRAAAREFLPQNPHRRPYGAAVIGISAPIEQLNYTAQGDAVNLASRLEAEQHFGTRSSSATRPARTARTGVPSMAEVVVKGKTNRFQSGSQFFRRRVAEYVARYGAAYEALERVMKLRWRCFRPSRPKTRRYAGPPPLHANCQGRAGVVSS